MHSSQGYTAFDLALCQHSLLKHICSWVDVLEEIHTKVKLLH